MSHSQIWVGLRMNLEADWQTPKKNTITQQTMPVQVVPLPFLPLRGAVGLSTCCPPPTEPALPGLRGGPVLQSVPVPGIQQVLSNDE